MTVLNQVILVGRIYRPAQRYYRPDGSAVVQFPLELNNPDERPHNVSSGSSRRRPTLTGCKQDRRQPTALVKKNVVQVVAFGELAEMKLEALQQGQSLRVVGRLNQRQWMTPQGLNRTQIEVIATDLRVTGECPHPE